jgi:hypothetical protein
MLNSSAIHYIYVEFNSISDSLNYSPLVKISEILEPCGFRFVATYTDYLTFDHAQFNVSNALFALKNA